jgi:hypothetical protein
VKPLGSLSLLGRTSHAAGGFVLFFVVGAAGFVGLRHAAPKQPIAFNHAKHVSNGVACTDCHAGVQTQAKATLPSVDVCMTCHQVALTDSAQEEKVRTVAAASQELNWVQLTQTPPNVFFSHRRHVAVAHLPCAECHGAMERATKPPDHAFRVFKMAACIGCHQQHRVNADCNDCHR